MKEEVDVGEVVSFRLPTRPDLFHPAAVDLVWQRVRQAAAGLEERPA